MSWITAFKRHELVNKISLTLLIMLIYKIGIYITVPGIDKGVLESFVGNTSALEMTNLISGGALTQFSVLALGVMPYITASIIVQLLSYDVVPVLSEWKRQGEHGNKKIKKLTYQLTAVFALGQGFAISYGLNRLYPGLVINDSIGNIIFIGIILALGTALLVLLSEVITKKGIGNGISVIIFASIMMSMPSVISMYYQTYISGSGEAMIFEIVKAALILLFLLLMIAFVVFVSKSERRIPIMNSVKTGNSENAVVGSEMNIKKKGDRQSFLPFKLLGVGVIPVIFAVSFILVPTTLAQYNPNAEWSLWVMKYISMDTWTGGALYALIIILFSYFYVFMQLNPEKLASDLKNGGNFIPGIRPGEETEVYLTGVLKRITLAGSVILAVIAVIPLIASAVMTLPATVQLGGVSIVIAVTVALDVQSRMAVYKNVVSYENVFRKGK